MALVLSIGALAPAAAPAAVPRVAPEGILVAGTGRSLLPSSADPGPQRVPALWMPVAGAVVRGFDVRAGPYGRGHRGIDIAAPVGALVRAPAAGTVVFAGPVAGTPWVTLRVAPGVLVTLGPLLDPVTTGRVRPMGPMGRVGPGHQVAPGGATAPGRPGGPEDGGATLHLGVRVDGVYVDPLAYLVDGPRARLAPLPTPGGLPGR